MSSWELFDLVTDPAESRDFLAAEPAPLAALVRLWDEYAARSGVILPSHDMS
jgi:hypothetical protein